MLIILFYFFLEFYDCIYTFGQNDINVLDISCVEEISRNTKSSQNIGLFCENDIIMQDEIESIDYLVNLEEYEWSFKAFVIFCFKQFGIVFFLIFCFFLSFCLSIEFEILDEIFDMLDKW